MKRALEYIKSNWKEGKRLKEIAEMYGVDAGNLARAFRSSEGKTILQYINQRRKEHVLSGLRDGRTFGYEIGFSLGFKTDRAFYQWVRRSFGVTLQQLRRRESNERMANRTDKE